MELTAILMTALNAVTPIILLILLGYFLKQKGFLSENFLAVGNKLVFKLMLPSMLFINIYRLDALSDIQWDVTLYALCAIVLIFCLSLICAIAATPVPQRRGVILQCCFRSNRTSRYKGYDHCQREHQRKKPLHCICNHRSSSFFK